MQTHVRSKVMWIPLIMVGALLYWSLALGLGGMSLSFLGGSAEEDMAFQTVVERVQPPASANGQPIQVHLQSYSDLSGAGGNQAHGDDGTGRLPATDEDAPPPPVDTIGRTAY